MAIESWATECRACHTKGYDELLNQCLFCGGEGYIVITLKPKPTRHRVRDLAVVALLAIAAAALVLWWTHTSIGGLGR